MFLKKYQIEEDQVSTTVVVRQINPEFYSRIGIHSETDETSKGIRVKADFKTAIKLKVGMERVVLFGDELAKDGINEAIHK